MTEPVLVTGATGFIGRALVAKLEAQGREIVAMGSAGGDVAAAATLQALSARRVGLVIHLAGRSYVPDSWSEPRAFMRTNVLGTLNVLELCRERHVPMIFASAYVYGVPDKLPISEDASPRPNNPYALSKHLAEQACQFYAQHYALAITVLRPFNVYGPGQASQFLVPMLLRQVAQERSIEVQDLAPRRDWVFLEDVVGAFLAAAQNMQGYRVYNVGSGVSTSVEQLIGRIQELTGTRLPVKTKGRPRSREIADTVADIGRARRELGWSPATSLSDGLRRCMESMGNRR